MKAIKTLSSNLSKIDYYSILCSLLTKILGFEIALNNKANKNVFFESVEFFKPNEKDISDKTHCHYNPNAILNIFMPQYVFKKYNIESLKLSKVKVEKLKRDGFRYWISIESQKDLEKLIKHMISKGYKFGEKA